MFHRRSATVQSAIGAEKRTPATTRRQFGALGLVAAAGCFSRPVSATVSMVGLAERNATISTNDGMLQAKLFHPASGKHRGLVMWGADEAASLSVAREMAAKGWAVLLVQDAIDDRNIYKQARAYVAWLEQQGCVAETGRGEQDTVHGLGYGYSLRSVGAALPRFSFSSAAQRAKAAMAATLFAVPDGVVPGQKLTRLSDAARLMQQRLI